MKILLLLLLALPLFAVDHPSEMIDLTDATDFPRFTKDELEQTGFPDHLHKFYWPGYDGELGPGMFCKGQILQAVEGLEIQSDKISFGVTSIEFDPFFQPCQVLPALEFSQYALDRCEKVLGLKPESNIHFIKPDNPNHYTELTGYGVWRKFKLQGDTCTPILSSSVMISHTVVDMITQWLLQSYGQLPDWFTNGVGAYVADMGPHFISYVAQFRPEGSILRDPMSVDQVLYHDPIVDLETDRKVFRIARYNAFLMVWNLVEYNGGLDSLKQLLAETKSGTDFKSACEKVYQMPMTSLMNRINPVITGEPIGTNIVPRNTSKPPKENNE